MEIVIFIISILFVIFSVIFYVKVWQAACRIIEDSDRAQRSRLDGNMISRLYLAGQTDEARDLFKAALCKLFSQITEKYDEATAEARIDRQIELYQKELELLGLTLPPHMSNGKSFIDAYKSMSDIRTHL